MNHLVHILELLCLALLSGLASVGGVYLTLKHLPSRLGLCKKPVIRKGKYAQGFGPASLASGASTRLVVQPQVALKGRRLIIPSDIAPAVRVNDLRIGNTSQLPSREPLPGRMFSEFAHADLELQTAQISQQIFLDVTNISEKPITFTAALVGDGIEGVTGSGNWL
jgi:hypothetical protein